MIRVACKLISALMMSLFLSAAASAAVIYTSSTLISGNRWLNEYRVVADGGLPVQEFTIYFAESDYANLSLESAPIDWDALVVQPDSALPAPGFYDALALGSSIASGDTLAGFAVSFDYLGQGKPHTQVFDVVDPSTFAVLFSGLTRQEEPPPGEVPEPATSSLLALALLGVLASKRQKPFLSTR